MATVISTMRMMTMTEKHWKTRGGESGVGVCWESFHPIPRPPWPLHSERTHAWGRGGGGVLFYFFQVLHS